ncbi:spore germination lipoprotein GerD [Aquibacillus salsiterrae]|uniref:Spore germination lipoprotein GerD n=1 Tax=Aquibacillus salsiterrae TaxID=2950439 RepID=A0A9X4AH61_9BACI|nr:spore germination lipoprotein GerD [Aquibacillus salsiterrae]MDC3417833.1 spore germination lipoprotein GerD [Aquibacillus salsiterrae]
MNRIIPIALICFSFLLLTACGGAGSANGEKTDYETTKKMVTDILKTDEGKKAITEVLNDDEMQKTFVIDSKLVKQSVTESLTSDKGKEFWTKMFEDPKFVESFAKSMQDKQEDVIKGLMSDAEYQKKMIEILQNPDMEKQMSTVVTGQEFRQYLEKVIQEQLDTPLFKAKISDLVLKAAENMKSGTKDQSSGESSDGGSGGDSSGGQGGDSGGESQ